MSTKTSLALALLALCIHLGVVVAADEDKTMQMRLAAESGESADVERLLDEGVDAELRQQLWKTPSHGGGRAVRPQDRRR